MKNSKLKTMFKKGEIWWYEWPLTGRSKFIVDHYDEESDVVHGVWLSSNDTENIWISKPTVLSVVNYLQYFHRDETDAVKSIIKHYEGA